MDVNLKEKVHKAKLIIEQPEDDTFIVTKNGFTGEPCTLNREEFIDFLEEYIEYLNEEKRSVF